MPLNKPNQTYIKCDFSTDLVDEFLKHNWDHFLHTDKWFHVISNNSV